MLKADIIPSFAELYEPYIIFLDDGYIDYDITLRLVDENGNRIPATWTVYNTSICKQKTAGGSEFACLAEGKAFAVATTDDGETYVCIIRVSPYPG